jgi:polyphosphate glucokinase
MTSPHHSGNEAIQIDATPENARILAIDVGGTGLKAAILNLDGEMQTERVRIPTPHPITPELLVDTLVNLVQPLGEFDVVSVGFPGVVRKGKILTAPNLGTEQLRDFNLRDALQGKFGKRVRVLNDADMQGFAAVSGQGVEMVITLGTGFGSSIFLDGELGPHLELAHLPFRKGETYDVQLGDKARKRLGKKRWSRRVERAIENLRVLTNFDTLYIGGGNASKIDFKLDPDVKTVSNEAGVKGGAWLWRKHIQKEPER